jgi:nicotinamidase-related amidase
MVEPSVEEHPALLVMDVQRGIVERFGGDPALLDRIGTALAAARSAAIPVIYVVVRFRAGYPEISQRNRAFSASRQAGRALAEGDPAAEIHPAIAPRPGDIVVTKRRVSAFAGSDLEVVLRAGGIDGLVLSGIATSGVVLSTLRYAADMDYRLSVLADCCADGDPEVQRVLLEKVFPRQATVLTAAEWRAAIAKSPKS